jgi:hypothetical protein
MQGGIKKFPEFFDIDSLMHREIYRLGWVLLGISSCKFCRGCAMQFGGSGVTSGRDSGFCITITHRATHRLLSRNSSSRKTFLSSPNHRTLRISLRATFGCSSSENGRRGDKFRNHGVHQIECDGRTPEDSKRILPLVLPTMAGSMKQGMCVCVCVCTQRSYFEGD